MRALFRLDARRESAEARWTEPSSDITRAILAEAPLTTPQRTQSAASAIKAPVVPAITAETPAPASTPLPETALAPTRETEQPAAQAPEEKTERPTRRRRWHRAA